MYTQLQIEGTPMISRVLLDVGMRQCPSTQSTKRVKALVSLPITVKV